MADDKPTEDEVKQQRDNAKGLIKEALSELLDERETKANEQKEQEEKDKGDNPESKRTEPKRSWLQDLIGF